LIELETIEQCFIGVERFSVRTAKIKALNEAVPNAQGEGVSRSCIGAAMFELNITLF